MAVKQGWLRSSRRFQVSKDGSSFILRAVSPRAWESENSRAWEPDSVTPMSTQEPIDAIKQMNHSFFFGERKNNKRPPKGQEIQEILFDEKKSWESVCAWEP